MKQVSTLGCLAALFAVLAVAAEPATDAPYLVVLGIAQDGGVPQAGTKTSPPWRPDGFRRLVTSLALVEPKTPESAGRRYLFEATPDLREQLAELDRLAPDPRGPGLDGVFLTHAHMGHYTGLMFLGHESMGAQGVPVFAMPRMAEYLRSSGPWSQLVRYGNIVLRELTAGRSVDLEGDLGSVRVTPFLVPHRQEFSEVVGYRIDGPHRSALFVPDIDGWEEWDEAGVKLEDQLRGVDLAFLDATFFANGEVAGRDMSGFPHPRIRETIARLAPLPAAERAKVRLIHLNHTNPALVAGTPERQELEAAGLRVAEEGERFDL